MYIYETLIYLKFLFYNANIIIKQTLIGLNLVQTPASWLRINGKGTYNFTMEPLIKIKIGYMFPLAVNGL